MAKPRQTAAPGRSAQPKQPSTLNSAQWYEQHEVLSHHLLHMMVQALSKPAGRPTDAALQPIAEAHAALRLHAKQIVGNATPVVLGADGRQQIPFEKLTEARAKVAVLEEELRVLRAASTAAHAPAPADGQAYAAGGQAMRADMLNVLSRRLADFSAASRRFPAMAVRLGQAAGVLKVAKKEIEEIRP